jgi:hypothetical protein
MKISFLFLSILVFSLYACGPSTKEAYLKKFESFIDDVSNERNNYTSEDWKEADKKYKQFNEELFDKFEDQLTFSEKATIYKYRVQYNAYKFSPF